MRTLLGLALFGYLVFAAVWVVSSGFVRERNELFNVANDPTRELWREMNAAFVEDYKSKTGETITIKMSHGGSGSQARSIIDGLDADIASLGLWTDTNAVAKANLIDVKWEERFQNRGLPFVSTIVIVVRKGNPKQIHDWADLFRDDVTIVTPNPKTSGNGKWSFLALWLAVKKIHERDMDCEGELAKLFKRVPVLDAGARGATMTFAKAQVGDVHLTWENEAQSEVKEFDGQLEIVYPKESIAAEPHVAIVDANARKKKTMKQAEAYVNFLYSLEGQAIGAKHGYRPTLIPVSVKRFPEMTLIPAATIGTWDEIQSRFFAEGAMFDRALAAGRPK